MSNYQKIPGASTTSALPMELEVKTLPPNYQQAMYPNLPHIQTVQPSQQPLQQNEPNQPPLTIQQPSVVVQSQNVPVGNRACKITCPSCRTVIVTQVDFVSSTRTHLLALLLCLGGCCCCAPIPYFVDSCKTVSHICPSCGAFIGSYKQ